MICWVREHNSVKIIRLQNAAFLSKTLLLAIPLYTEVCYPPHRDKTDYTINCQRQAYLPATQPERAIIKWGIYLYNIGLSCAEGTPKGFLLHYSLG